MIFAVRERCSFMYRQRFFAALRMITDMILRTEVVAGEVIATMQNLDRL